MDVALGSTNPVKVEAVERATGAAVEPVAVDSGVSAQPRSSAETVEGAETRARRALERTTASLGVGLEGGVTADGVRPGVWLVMWAAVTDGDRLECGAGPSVRLPAAWARDIEEGYTLGDALERAGVDALGGAIGVLTEGAVGRADALTTATRCALAPFHSGQFE